MTDKTHHREVQVTAWKELAKRAKRLAGSLSDGPDRDTLLHYSKELEEKLTKLDVTPEVRERKDKS